MQTKMDTSDWTVDDHIEWMRHHAESVKIMTRMKLNVKVTTMIHRDLPWLNYRVSDHLDPVAVQRAMLDHGPCPVFARKAAERGK